MENDSVLSWVRGFAANGRVTGVLVVVTVLGIQQLAFSPSTSVLGSDQQLHCTGHECGAD